ncbi:penicillin-binding transpeptidase domain-containing protein [Natranaerobius trueperi]|uniref:Peptidoglycan glycosyltransferase n=1 Tax=Natranaerobius trueperi TaxID=759412 RepID=A0A226BYX3_9FIRM|nr:penicillin-binding transpeptidase domain-containing protein [Natranaerobius trueperi]OWZ84125.1 peptidoglycan glycosyltransferase [Natranaerobius trueperi]
MDKRKQHLLQTKRRLVLLFIALFVITISLIGRLGWIQLVKGEEFQEKAWEQWNTSIPASSPRGDIVDRNGELMVSSLTAETLIALPPQINDPEQLSVRLSSILEKEEDEIYDKLTADSSQEIIQRVLSQDKAKKIRALGNPGLKLTSDTQRYYPHGRLASQLLGFVGVDQGWAGLEYYYDDELQGRDGRMVFQTDGRQQQLPHGVQQYIPPKDGMTLQTTIDNSIQYIMERELERAMVEYKPEGAMAVAMEPDTGEILGMSSKPDYYPGEYDEFDEQQRRISPINNTFEPGSTFKLVTLAASIEEGIYNPDEDLFCPGHIDVAGVEIGCWTRNGHGAIDFLEVVYGSCNPGFVTLGQRLGKEKLFNYISGFGFGSKTGIDLPGETVGLLFNLDNVGPVELATSSFGQGVSVTPIQQVIAVSAIANGGELYEPRVAKNFIDENDKVIEQEPQQIRRVISEETSKEVRNIMQGVVEEGSGTNADIDGYNVAGKTGTAEKVGPDGGYIPGELIVAFVGFAPAEDPEVLIYVAVDTPTKGPAWGGQIAAPIFKNMMEDILKHLDVPSSYDEKEEQEYVEVPNLLNLTFDEAEEQLDQKGLIVDIVGDGEIITDQIPEPGEQVSVQSSIMLYLGATEGEEESEYVTVPNLKGRTLRKATEILEMIGLDMDAKGSGIVESQEVEPGEQVRKGTEIKVEFREPTEPDQNQELNDAEEVPEMEDYLNE